MDFRKENSASDFHDVSELSCNLLECPIDFLEYRKSVCCLGLDEIYVHQIGFSNNCIPQL